MDSTANGGVKLYKTVPFGICHDPHSAIQIRIETKLCKSVTDHGESGE